MKYLDYCLMSVFFYKQRLHDSTIACSAMVLSCTIALSGVGAVMYHDSTYSVVIFFINIDYTTAP